MAADAAAGGDGLSVTASSVRAGGWSRNIDQALAPTLIGVLGALLAWGRLPGAARGTLWAEDALIFSQRALHPDLLPFGVFTPYDGYVHALPQLIASTAWALVPIDAMSAAITSAACATVGIIGAVVFVLTRDWHLHLAGRVILAFTTVLAPTLSAEVLGNLTNLHWFLLWLAPFVFLARPRHWWSSGTLGLAAFLVLSSEPQAVFFMPLLLWRVRDRYRWAVMGAAALGAAIQAVAILGSSARERGTNAAPLEAVVGGYALQVPLTALVGTTQSAAAVVGLTGWTMAFVAVMPFLLCAAWFASGSRRRTALAVVFTGGSVLIWTVGFCINYVDQQNFAARSADQLLDGVAPLRYGAVPIMMLYAVAALAIGRALNRRSHTNARALAWGTAAIVVGVLAASYLPAVSPARSAGPEWRDEIQAARGVCIADKHAPTTVVIHAAPNSSLWSVRVPCDRLVDPPRPNEHD